MHMSMHAWKRRGNSRPCDRVSLLSSDKAHASPSPRRGAVPPPAPVVPVAATMPGRTPPPSPLRALVPFLPALAFAALVFYVSSLEDPLPPVTGLLWDKALHAAEYGALGALLAWPLARLAPRRSFLLAVVLASAYGASDELHQGLVPGRDASARDWAADTVGGALGAGAALWLRRRRAGTDSG